MVSFPGFKKKSSFGSTSPQGGSCASISAISILEITTLRIVVTCEPPPKKKKKTYRLIQAEDFSTHQTAASLEENRDAPSQTSIWKISGFSMIFLLCLMIRYGFSTSVSFLSAVQQFVAFFASAKHRLLCGSSNSSQIFSENGRSESQVSQGSLAQWPNVTWIPTKRSPTGNFQPATILGIFFWGGGSQGLPHRTPGTILDKFPLPF